MTRAIVVVGVLVAVAGMAVAYARARARDAERGGAGLPPLPEHLRRASTTWVIFTTPHCATCGTVEATLSRTFPDHAVVKVDATVDVELADRYAVRRAPTVLRADGLGAITDRLVGADAVQRVVPV